MEQNGSIHRRLLLRFSGAAAKAALLERTISGDLQCSKRSGGFRLSLGVTMDSVPSVTQNQQKRSFRAYFCRETNQKKRSTDRLPTGGAKWTTLVLALLAFPTEAKGIALFGFQVHGNNRLHVNHWVS